MATTKITRRATARPKRGDVLIRVYRSDKGVEEMVLPVIPGAAIRFDVNGNLVADDTDGGVATGLRTKVAMPASTASSGSDGQYAVDAEKLAVYVTGTGWVFFPGYQV